MIDSVMPNGIIETHATEGVTMTTYDDNFKSATPHHDFDDVTLRNMTADQVVAAIVAGRSTPDLGLVLAGITAEVQKRLDDAAAVLKPKGDKRVLGKVSP